MVKSWRDVAIIRSDRLSPEWALTVSLKTWKPAMSSMPKPLEWRVERTFQRSTGPGKATFGIHGTRVMT